MCFVPQISYLHTGATKSWYGVPGGSAGKMEEVMKEYLPDLFQVEPDLMMKASYIHNLAIVALL